MVLSELSEGQREVPAAQREAGQEAPAEPEGRHEPHRGQVHHETQRHVRGACIVQINCRTE